MNVIYDIRNESMTRQHITDICETQIMSWLNIDKPTVYIMYNGDLPKMIRDCMVHIAQKRGHNITKTDNEIIDAHNMLLKDGCI